MVKLNFLSLDNCDQLDLYHFLTDVKCLEFNSSNA